MLYDKTIALAHPAQKALAETGGSSRRQQAAGSSSRQQQQQQQQAAAAENMGCLRQSSKQTKLGPSQQPGKPRDRGESTARQQSESPKPTAKQAKRQRISSRKS